MASQTGPTSPAKGLAGNASARGAMAPRPAEEGPAEGPAEMSSPTGGSPPHRSTREAMAPGPAEGWAEGPAEVTSQIGPLPPETAGPGPPPLLETAGPPLCRVATGDLARDASGLAGKWGPQGSQSASRKWGQCGILDSEAAPKGVDCCARGGCPARTRYICAGPYEMASRRSRCRGTVFSWGRMVNKFFLQEINAHGCMRRNLGRGSVATMRMLKQLAGG